MQAIVTKYLGPTNYRGSRIRASAQAGSVTIGYDDALDTEDNHRAAAKALMVKYGWDEHSRIIGSGGLPDGRGNCYVLARKAVR